MSEVITAEVAASVAAGKDGSSALGATKNKPAAVQHAAAWFEIGVHDLDRAQAFYSAMLGRPLIRETMCDETFAMFEKAEDGIGGCLLPVSRDLPLDAATTLVYLNAEPSIDAALERAIAAGGQVAIARTELPGGMGFFAHVIDSEGGRVGLHAMK